LAAQLDGSLSADPINDDALTEDDTADGRHLKDTGVDAAESEAPIKKTQRVRAVEWKSTSRSPSPYTSQKTGNSADSMTEDGLDSDDQIIGLGPKPDTPLPESLREAFHAVEELAQCGKGLQVMCCL